MLEPNHSHFVFVDAGPEAVGQFGKEIALRAALEDTLCRDHPRDPDEESVSPVMAHGSHTALPTHRMAAVRSAQWGMMTMAAPCTPLPSHGVHGMRSAR
jgi:hypothetical protein